MPTITKNTPRCMAVPGWVFCGIQISCAPAQVVMWAPQNDLLGHKQMRAFLSHCGANSMYESAYHGVLPHPLQNDEVRASAWASPDD